MEKPDNQRYCFNELIELKNKNKAEIRKERETQPPKQRDAEIERLREAMRKPESCPGRKRLGPPIFWLRENSNS